MKLDKKCTVYEIMYIKAINSLYELKYKKIYENYQKVMLERGRFAIPC